MEFVLPKDIPVYLEQLTELQRKAFDIAQDHLKSSFHIGRSNGLKEWRAQQSENEEFLNTIDGSLANNIYTTRMEKGTMFRIEELDEFVAWKKLKQAKEKYLKTLTKDQKRELEGTKVELTTAFQEWLTQQEK